MIHDLAHGHAVKGGPWSWATCEGFRRELERRTGRRVGRGSIQRVLKRLARRGEIEHRRVYPGQRKANGSLTGVGTSHNRVIPRWEQRKIKLRKAAEAKRRAIIAEQRAAAAAAAERRERLEEHETQQRVEDAVRAREWFEQHPNNPFVRMAEEAMGRTPAGRRLPEPDD